MQYLLASRRAGDGAIQITRTLHNFAAWSRSAEGEITVIAFRDDMTVEFSRHLTPEERRRGRAFDRNYHQPSIEGMLLEDTADVR